MIGLLFLVSAAQALPFLGFTLGLNKKADVQLTEQTYPVVSCADAAEAAYFSCLSPNTVAADSCCYENYGIILQTQFWDYNTAYADSSAVVKRADSDTSEVFTIHGLWDDLCDGSYKLLCQPSLEFASSDNVSDIIINTFKRPDLYSTMVKNWIDTTLSSPPAVAAASLWVHEFNKHGTCFNTLLPKCFTGLYTRYENAIAFFQKVVEVWEGLPTYTFLLDAGIVPSADTQYQLSDVQSALESAHGASVYVGCTLGAINQIYYYHEVKGNVLNGEYKATDSLETSNCPDSVWYYPK